MIGKVMTGASFYHCISYCLEDKKELSEQQKNQLSALDQLQHSGRAEVLEYNRCFGNKKELTRQFSDVQKLSRRVEKPVLHLALRLAPGEELTADQWREIGRECAKEFGVSDNQYLAILHKDTAQPHIHIVANRVGFDGKAAKDSNSYRRMAELCRKMERRYQLKEVLSPNAFLPKERQGLRRSDERKEKLGSDIRNTLRKVSDFPAFEWYMKTLGYQVEKGRGIAFIDDKKVRTKGSEFGFSLVVIEKALSQNKGISLQEKGLTQGQDSFHHYTPTTKNNSPLHKIPEAPQQGNSLFDILIKAESEINQIPFELSAEHNRKKKKIKRRM
jgi:Relaxase/Mobilisation nuclease domain